MVNWKLTAGPDGVIYKVLNDVFYHPSTNNEVITVLDHCRRTSTRVRVEYGDILSGQAWGDADTGYISNSYGGIKIPLILYNRRSTGDAGLLEWAIVRITTTRGKSVLYQHPFYRGKES